MSVILPSWRQIHHAPQTCFCWVSDLVIWYCIFSHQSTLGLAVQYLPILQLVDVCTMGIVTFPLKKDFPACDQSFCAVATCTQKCMHHFFVYGAIQNWKLFHHFIQRLTLIQFHFDFNDNTELLFSYFLKNTIFPFQPINTFIALCICFYVLMNVR